MIHHSSDYHAKGTVQGTKHKAQRVVTYQLCAKLITPYQPHLVRRDEGLRGLERRCKSKAALAHATPLPVVRRDSFLGQRMRAKKDGVAAVGASACSSPDEPVCLRTFFVLLRSESLCLHGAACMYLACGCIHGNCMPHARWCNVQKRMYITAQRLMVASPRTTCSTSA